MSLNEQFFFLSPVQVVKVTAQNLEEVAEWCGGKVAQTESRHPKRKAQGILDPYVWVPTPAGSKISSAFPGMFITRRIVVTPGGEFKVTWSVFRRDYFEANYFASPSDAVEKTWAKKDPQIAGGKAEEKSTTINVFVGSTEEAAKIINKNKMLVVNEERKARFERGNDEERPTLPPGDDPRAGTEIRRDAAL